MFSAGVTPNEASVYGIISLVFWAITLIVSVKYVTFIMRADNDGEGGIMALISLVQSAALERRFAKWALIALGIFGASLFYGDGMITPAISVLSAVEGLEGRRPRSCLVRRPDHVGNPRCAVQRSTLRYCRGRLVGTGTRARRGRLTSTSS